MKVSVITINYNNLNGLKQTMQSVFEQDFHDYEYIIVDGGSNDGSREFIEQHSGKLSSWVSESDGGIYNAMNKGIGMAKGEYLMFLNSGDYMNSSGSLSAYGLDSNKEDILCADIRVVLKDGEWVKKVPEPLTFDYFIGDTLPHQSALIKRQLFYKAGMYSEQLRFVSDWKFYIDALVKHGATLRRIPIVACSYNFDGISSKPENAAALQAERIKVLKEEYALLYADYIHYRECKAALRNYTSSRAHKLLNRLMGSAVYKKFIK